MIENKTQLRRGIKHVCDQASQMCGSLQPEETNDAREYVEEIRCALSRMLRGMLAEEVKELLETERNLRGKP